MRLHRGATLPTLLPPGLRTGSIAIGRDGCNVIPRIPIGAEIETRGGSAQASGACAPARLTVIGAWQVRAAPPWVDAPGVLPELDRRLRLGQIRTALILFCYN